MDWKNKPNMIFNKVKQQMFAKGVESFYYLDIFIREFDPEFTGNLSPHFFNLFMNKIGVFLTTQEIRNIKDIYVRKGQEVIQYMDFLNDVKYSIPEKIANLLNEAWNKVDPENLGSVVMDTLTQAYKAKQHPHVLSRRKTPEEVFGNFVNGMMRKAQEETVKREGFVDYYAELNFCIPNERENYFEDLLKGTWGLLNAADYVSPKRLKDMEMIIFEKIREKSNGKTNQWKAAKKALHFFDLSDSGACDYENFKRGLDKFGCNFKQYEMKALFDAFDVDHSGKLEYEQFAKVIMDIDINGMVSKPNLLKTLGTNYFKVTH